MRVTIIPVDRTITIDGITAHPSTWPFEDKHIHAIQFKDGKGEMEIRSRPPENKPFMGTEAIQPYIDHFHAWIEKVKNPIGRTDFFAEISDTPEAIEKVMATTPACINPDLYQLDAWLAEQSEQDVSEPSYTDPSGALP